MASSITRIPATRSVFTAVPMTSITKRRVAAYARVSTDSDEQFTSYEAQIDYYTKFIQQRDDWTYVSVYTEEGMSYGQKPKKYTLVKVWFIVVYSNLFISNVPKVMYFIFGIVKNLFGYRKTLYG